MLADLLLPLAVGYAVLILVFTAGAFASRYPEVSHHRPRVSILVAARNEEEHIGACLESLSALRYPAHLLEVIIIDDRSTDGTGEIVRRCAAANPVIRLIRTDAEEGGLRGKTNAVARGIDIATGDIFLFTDADCRVPAGWVDEMVKYYADESIGVVAGFTRLRGRDWFSQMQALDWFVLFSAAAATNRLGIPTTAVGTNLSVRREAYEAVGGYRSIPFSVTEDYALFHAVTSRGYRARIPMDPRTLVESVPCGSWKELFGQKKRWFTGGRAMDMKSLLIFAIPYLFGLALPLAAVLAPGPAVWYALFIKLGVDFLFVLPAVLRFGRPGLLPVYPLYALYYYIYVLIFPPIVLAGREVIWKDRSFKDPPRRAASSQKSPRV